jgi:hypothetical protein
VVVDRFNKSNNLSSKNSYINKCREKYNRYITNVEDNEWFDSISHIVEDDAYTAKRFNLKKNVIKFLNYINTNWLVPDGVDDIEKYKIWKEKDRLRILKEAIECRISNYHPSRTSFVMIIKLLKETYGYNIIKKREYYDNNKRRTYNLIVDYDEDTYIRYKKPMWIGENKI